tara:strand:+ start:7495 stop:8139 length:645 start_codon:yes stop_codon:yes gene_type:complete
MEIEEVMKKLKEIKVDAYNNLTSGEDESELQLESSTEFPLEEDAAGEEVKPDRPKAENVKEYKTLSRTTPMDGKTRAKEDIYVNDATLKAPTSEEIWSKLEDLKKNVERDKSSDDDKLRELFGEEKYNQMMSYREKQGTKHDIEFQIDNYLERAVNSPEHAKWLDTFEKMQYEGQRLYEKMFNEAPEELVEANENYLWSELIRFAKEDGFTLRE